MYHGTDYYTADDGGDDHDPSDEFDTERAYDFIDYSVDSADDDQSSADDYPDPDDYDTTLEHLHPADARERWENGGDYPDVGGQ